LKVFELVGCSA